MVVNNYFIMVDDNNIFANLVKTNHVVYSIALFTDMQTERSFVHTLFDPLKPRNWYFKQILKLLRPLYCIL